MSADRRGSVTHDAEELRSRWTEDEREAFARLRELSWQTGEIESELYAAGHGVLLQQCRNFLGYVDMALHDGAYESSVGYFIEDTNGELDGLVAADPAQAAYAAEYRALRATCVAAYARVLA